MLESYLGDEFVLRDTPARIFIKLSIELDTDSVTAELLRGENGDSSVPRARIVDDVSRPGLGEGKHVPSDGERRGDEPGLVRGTLGGLA
jgi:hypothetical protein